MSRHVGTFRCVQEHHPLPMYRQAHRPSYFRPMYRHVDRATSDVQAHEPLSADVQAVTLMSLWALTPRAPSTSPSSLARSWRAPRLRCSTRAVYQLTDDKAHAQPTPEGHQALVLPTPIVLQWATGASAAGKRKRDDSGDDDSLLGQGRGRGRRRRRRGLGLGTGLRSPFRASCGRSRPLL